MTAYDIIEAKKHGKTLSKAQIDAFVRMVADETASDAQIAAFCMAVCIRGMTDEEAVFLTQAMADSGERLSPPADGIFADKHSTGGVSDSTTLVLVPVLASLGVKCAKYSGRGLGHTGGTLDKLESFAGFNVNLTAQQFSSQVERIGAAIAGQTKTTVPADKRMYAVRDVTATVDSIPLIASSVMSKKLASFAQVILLDVKYGDGAFMKTARAAEQLARLMVAAGTAAGRQVEAAVTDMSAPLGDAIGCNAEVREVIEVLRGKRNNLSRLSLLHCERILRMAQGTEEKRAKTLVQEAIDSGAALEKFRQIVSAQGGDTAAFDDAEALPLAPERVILRAPGAGKLHIHAQALGKACAQLGGGRQREGEDIDHTVGILLKRRAGDSVAQGEEVAEVFCRERRQEALDLAQSAFEVRHSYRARPLVHCIISKEDISDVRYQKKDNG